MRRRVPTRHSRPQNAVCHVSFVKKTEVPQEGIFDARSPPGAVARRLGGDARGSSDGSKGACGGDGGSTARIVRGRNEYHRNALRGIAKQGAIWSSGSNRANRTESGAPQLTLDTPRASAGAAGSALSEEPRTPPDCDVNDRTEQVRHRAPLSHSAAHSTVNLGHATTFTGSTVGAADVAPSISPFQKFKENCRKLVLHG